MRKRKIRQVFNVLLLLTDLPHTRRDSKSATDIGATPHCGDRFLSVEKGTDEIPATGGRQCLSHGLPLRSYFFQCFSECVCIRQSLAV